MASEAAGGILEHRKKLGRARLRLEENAANQPMAAPPVEVSFQYADENGLLELAPFTQRIRGSGKMEPLPDAKLSRYCFRIRIDGDLVALEQVADKYEHSQAFSPFEPLFALSLSGKGFVRLDPGKPKAIFFNVPGGGPKWIPDLWGIE